MKLDKKGRNRKYKWVLSGLYAAQEINTSYYLCHALDYFSCDYEEMLECYPELHLLFPEDFDGDSITDEKLIKTESFYSLREIILQFAIEMTE